MDKAVFDIISFPLKDASQLEYTAINQHNNRLRHERLPDDPPVPLIETINNLQNIPAFVDARFWVIWNSDKTGIIASGNVILMRMEENKHMTQFDISVVPEYRNQGIGRRLLQVITETGRSDNRSLFITETVDRIPGGEAFMHRIGAQKGLETHTNQLRIMDLNPSMIAEWLSIGEKHLTEFEIGLWEGAYPEGKIKEIVELYELTNQQPFGNLEIEAMHITPEQLRQNEQYIFARGNQRWTFYLVDRSSGKFAGYTETTWNPNRPEILRQEMTGVFPEYRNKGLGRCLKASMLDKVLRERPEVKYIRTDNADSNSAMLKINNELGFKPYLADTVWQVEIQKVTDYLKVHGL